MSSYTKITIGCDKTDLHEKLRVAVGHVLVSESDIKDSYLGSPNIATHRLKRLNHLLNDVHEHGIEHPGQRIHLLILPEVSIPHSWATFITRWAREHQIGIICGLEHRLKGKEAWNELLAALPYRASNGVKACVPIRRLKKHYAPREALYLKGNHLIVPQNTSKSQYQLFQWRGASFAIYNCYELTSLEDRAIFKGKVDFIVSSEYNPDVSYFSNIVEAAARDLHCYIIQANSAQFGDSRVVSPAKSDFLNPLQIKGGDNQTFLTMELPLKELRDHQKVTYDLQKDSKFYKPTPPDFEHKHVMERINLKK